MNVFQRARESAVSEESSLRPRLRGSLAVMLERYCAKHRRCRGAPSVATAIRKYDGISEFVARPRPDVPVVQTERAARIDQQAHLNRGQRSMVVRERAALERYLCLNPVIHDMPQIFSLSFTVSPRHYAARSR